MVWLMRGNCRARKIALALVRGARASGYSYDVRSDGEYKRPRGKIAAMYGYQKNMPLIMADYLNEGKAVVFVDLGYWGRREGGRWDGYHKVSVNARHPDAYLMDVERNHVRFERQGVLIQPWQDSGGPVIVAGMSAKSAESYGFEPEEWERWAITELRKHTKRDIIYRPKPSWFQACPIKGSVFQKSSAAIERVLTNCHAVVTHHSNVAVDALIAGVPAFCWDGVARCMSLQDLSMIEEPYRPKHRDQWAANIAWCQWNTSEISTGRLFQYLKKESLIP